MKGQGSSALKILLTGFIALNFALGCGLGVEAVIRGAPSLWRIADLFFDFALFGLMLTRASALLKS